MRMSIRSVTRTLVPALVLLVCLAAPAWAAEEGGGEGGLLELDWKASATAIAIFLVLLWVLGRFAWRPVLRGLQQREDTIRRAVDDARKASEEAQRMMAEYEKKLATAADEAHAIAEEARKDAADVSRRLEEEARARAEETLQRSLKEIEQAQRKAQAQLLEDVTGIATEAASRIVRRHLTPEDNADLVDAVVREFAAGKGGEGTA
jgi:F-type H+-transporting ATPase subunit b